MSKVIDMFSRQVLEEQNISEDDELEQEYIPSHEDPLEEAAASKVCAAAAKLAIECELDTFDEYLEDLMSAIRQYQNVEKVYGIITVAFFIGEINACKII